MPDTFEKLESFNEGHKFECFHNLDIDVINAETKALHHSAFFEQKDVKDKFYQLLTKFANYHIPEQADLNTEHGLVENFCELFTLRES